MRFQGKYRFFLVVTFLALAGCSSASKKDEKKELSPTEKARIFIGMANGALVEGDATGALGHLHEAARFDSELPELHHSRALAYFYKKDLQTALEAAQTAVELKPDYSDALNTYGKILMDVGRPREAIAPLTKAARNPLYRNAYKAQSNLGILYYRQGKYDLARKTLAKATRMAPQSSCVAHFYLGNIAIKKRQFKKGVRHLDKATRNQCGQFDQAHYALGVAYVQTKQYELAKKKFLEVQSLFPDSPMAEKSMAKLRILP